MILKRSVRFSLGPHQHVGVGINYGPTDVITTWLGWQGVRFGSSFLFLFKIGSIRGHVSRV